MLVGFICFCLFVVVVVVVVVVVCVCVLCAVCKYLCPFFVFLLNTTSLSMLITIKMTKMISFSFTVYKQG